MADYAVHFIDEDRPHAIVYDTPYLPRNGDELCLGNEDGRSYTRWIVIRVVHNVMPEGLPNSYTAAPPNVFVSKAPNV